MRRDYQTIRIDDRGEAHWLTLNRPEALNAITTEMVEELDDYFGGLARDRTCRVVVMRGAGRAFCAGLDIKAFGASDAPFGRGFGFQGLIADVYVKMHRCPQPIVALVHGAAAGGGFAFALAADIRIAGESARITPRSSRVLFMLTGASSTRRALATGLVSEVGPDDPNPLPLPPPSREAEAPSITEA